MLILLSTPALTLRALCAGRSCDRPVAGGQAQAPFCSLPKELRSGIVAGFYDGRSPDVMAVSGPVPVRGGTGTSFPAPWPSLASADASQIPIVFGGAGVAPGSRVEPGTGLEDVAPTVAELIGLKRPHPEVRSGKTIPGVGGGPAKPQLVLEVVWKGVGAGDLIRANDEWPTLRELLDQGAGTLEGRVPSLPLDPAAALMTLGTGGLPSEHGMTGTLVRNNQGQMVRAWGRGAPFSVIATLGDHLDELRGQRPRIGIVAADGSDRGAIGGNWYLNNDRDDVITRRGLDAQVAEATGLLGSGYGSDKVPDLLVVVMRGPIDSMDRALRDLVTAAQGATNGATTVVVTATGSATSSGERRVRASELFRDLTATVPGAAKAIDGTVPGGLFLDQDALAAGVTSEDRIVAGLRGLKAGDARPVFADVFSTTAVTFARYC